MIESGLTAVTPANLSSNTLAKKEKFLRLSAVRDRIPCSRATIYRLISEAKFPRPYPLGAGAVAWRESEIDAWIQARIDCALAAEVK